MPRRKFDCFLSNQARPPFRKIAAEHSSDVQKRMAAADQASVVRAVTENVAFGTQDRILQWDGI